MLGITNLINGVLSLHDDLVAIKGVLDSSKTVLDSIRTHVATIDENVVHVYDRLEHVKIDSYVNVRVMDEFGLLPVPSSVITGLLVSAYAFEGQQHHVVVDSGHINVDGSVNTYVIDGSVAITNTPHVIVDSGNVLISGTVTVSNVVHTIVDSGSIALSAVAHVIVDSGSVVLGAVAHVIVDSGSVAISNVVHVIVDSAAVLITEARMYGWDVIGKAWSAIRAFGGTTFRVANSAAPGGFETFVDSGTATLISGSSGFRGDATRYTDGMTSQVSGSLLRSIVKAEAL